MQQGLNQLKDDLWDKLNRYFLKHASGKEQILNSCVQELIRDIFQDASQQDVDYIIKNMHRLDSDESGQVSFPQLANFLFKKHCGQMSLQKRHLKGSMVKGAERKMNESEFKILLNEAVSFLKVRVPDQISEEIFRSTDKDLDGFITYVQYFQAIDLFVCKSKNQTTKTIAQPIKTNPKGSRIRTYLWNQLKRLYQAYVLGRHLPLTDLRNLVISIIPDLTELQLTFILSGLYKIKGSYVLFIEFAVLFFRLVGELGVSRFSQNHSQGKRNMSCEEFIILFRNTFKFLNVSVINTEFIKLIYLAIKGGKQFITYQEFLIWIKEFLSCQLWYGQPYYFIQDDPDNDKGNNIFIISKPKQLVPLVQQVKAVRLTFSDNDLAYKVRQRVFKLLEKYDLNQDSLFSKQEIQFCLTDLLKEDKIQLQYVTRNVFRYDIDGDHNVTYDELTNFCVQQHFGQMAIQRLHRKKFYVRGSERLMNKEQFGKTLNIALDFIQMQATQSQIDLIFSQIDLGKDGWISYELYFLFLRYYFGSFSMAYLKPKELQPAKPASFKTILLDSLKGLSSYEKLLRLLLEQLRYIFLQYDQNKNLSFEPNEIQNILLNVFSFQPHEINMIMFQIFRVDASYAQTISFQDLVSIILNIYFINIWLLRRYDNVGRTNWKLRKINLSQFKALMIEGCYFITIKPFQEDLQVIFRDLDSDKDNFITLQEYIAFIRKYIGRNMAIHDQPPTIDSPKKPVKKVVGVQQQEIGFIEAIWGELQILYNRYDGGSKGFMTEQQFKTFAIEVLNQKSDQQLKYIFWNLFRLDSDFDKKIEFNQFAPYVLKHAGEIALQRFHIQQPKGKNNLTEDQLFIVLSNAYNFLTTMPKSRSIVKLIYQRLAKQDSVSYGNYLGWITNAVAKRFR